MEVFEAKVSLLNTSNKTMIGISERELSARVLSFISKNKKWNPLFYLRSGKMLMKFGGQLLREANKYEI